MATNLSAIRDLLLPGLHAVKGQYKEIPTRWSQLFKTSQSNMALERTAQMRYLGLAQLKTEGAPMSFDNQSGQRFIYNQEHIEVALGYAITRKAVDDNLYKSQFNPSNLGLQHSFRQFKEITAANVFNTGNVYNAAIAGDGVALFSTAHPTDGGSFANTPTVQIDLNETSLLNAQTTIRNTFVDQANLKILAQARKLAVPASLEPVAVRLTKTALRPGTNDNDVNAILYTAGGIPDGYMVNEFFTSNYAWFLLTDIDGLIHFERVGFEMDMWVDETTQNLLVSGYERYSFSYNDPRAAWGSFPTS